MTPTAADIAEVRDRYDAALCDVVVEAGGNAVKGTCSPDMLREAGYEAVHALEDRAAKAEAALGQAKSEFRAEVRVQIEKWDEQVTFHGERADKAEAALAAALECARVRGKALKSCRDWLLVAKHYKHPRDGSNPEVSAGISQIDAALAIQSGDPALGEVPP